jgi:hypothetical protein
MSELTSKDLEGLYMLGDYPEPFPPPHLVMEDFCDYIVENLKYVSPELLERQHQLKMKEKSQMIPFRFK